MSDYTLIENLSQEPLTLPYPLIGVLRGGGQGVVADTPTNVAAYFAVPSNDVGVIVNLRTVPSTTPSTITVAAGLSSVVTLTGTQSLTNKTLETPKIKTALFDNNGNEFIKTTDTPSAINELTITNSAAGNPVILSATGGDTNITLSLRGKGTGGAQLGFTGGRVGFYGTAPIALQTGVAVTAGGVHAALVALGLITA